MPYTLQQRAQFVVWFAECKNDYRRFEARVKLELRVNANVPELKTVRKWKETFLETGSVEMKPPVRKK